MEQVSVARIWMASRFEEDRRESMKKAYVEINDFIKT
jgi:hypothetical protein